MGQGVYSFYKYAKEFKGNINIMRREIETIKKEASGSSRPQKYNLCMKNHIKSIKRKL